MKKDCLKNVKKESKIELKLLDENINTLFNLFYENPITYNNNEIWDYINTMNIQELSVMFAKIITKLDRLNICECYFNPVIMKYLFCEYIQELRYEYSL